MAMETPLAAASGVREVVLASEAKEAHHLKTKTLSCLGYAAILTTYSTSSSTAFMPFIFGRLGFVVAPVLLGLYMVLCAALQNMLLDIAINNPDVHTMPDLAKLVAGRFGNKSYQFLQVANQQLFLPCALLFVIKSLKQVVLPASLDGRVDAQDQHGILSCNVVWIFVGLAFGLVGTNLQRRFGHAASLSIATCVVNGVQVALIVARVLLNPDGSDPGSKTPSEALPAFTLDADSSDRGYWVDMFTAVSSFGYCYVPVFIATEAMQELPEKSQGKKAVWISTLVMFILYGTVGLFPVLYWGWQRPYEVLTELKGDFIGRTANLMLMLASGMDFLITGISLNQRLQEIADPDFDAHDWSVKACWKWFMYSLPSLFTSLLMLCFIPDLNSLVGLMTAFVVPFSQLMGPAILALIASRKGMLGCRLGVVGWAIVLAGLLVGMLMLVVGSIATIYSIFFSGPLIQGNFFCQAVAG